MLAVGTMSLVAGAIGIVCILAVVILKKRNG